VRNARTEKKRERRAFKIGSTNEQNSRKRRERQSGEWRQQARMGETQKVEEEGED
jgi:hypothetical protein